MLRAAPIQVQPAEPGPPPRRCSACVAVFITFVILSGLLFVLVLSAALFGGQKYYVAIDTASGLDPATDLPWPVLTPEFNLTLRVTSWSVVGAACLDPAMDVAVAYRGLALARASPPPRVCARGGAGRSRCRSSPRRGTECACPVSRCTASRRTRGAGLWRSTSR